jgi:hypothetical protein
LWRRCAPECAPVSHPTGAHFHNLRQNAVARERVPECHVSCAAHDAARVAARDRLSVVGEARGPKQLRRERAAVLSTSIRRTVPDVPREVAFKQPALADWRCLARLCWRR